MIGMKEQRPPIVPSDALYQRHKDDSSLGWTRAPPRISAQLAAATPPITTICSSNKSEPITDEDKGSN
ncbi:hypothetical protein ACFX1T_047317 [Malus domestica]